MPKRSRDYIVIFINGERHNVSGQRSFLMLADFLRYELKLVGTKIVCAEGDCGACTVLCRRTRKNSGLFVPINACIVMLAQLDGCHILTVEALKEGEKLSVVQKALVDNHASQCGFCTPGFAMAISGMFEKPKERLCEQKVKNCLTGNLCRCTGYQPIINAVLSLNDASIRPLSDRYSSQNVDDELFLATSSPVNIIDNDQEIFAPLTLNEAVAWRLSRKDSCLVGGATDVGVWINKDKFAKKPLLSLHLIDELYNIDLVDNRVMVGARVSLSELRLFLKKLVPSLSSFLNIFASPQIKNIATLVGNIANGSPIGDSLPFMMVAEGRVHVVGQDGERLIAMEDLYQGYKSLSLKDREIITHASFLVPKSSEKLRLDKVSLRKDLDIAGVNAAFLCDLDKDHQVLNVKLALGGVAAFVIRLKRTEAFLKGQTISPKVIDDASFILAQEISPLSDLRGSADYRRMLAEKLFRRFFDDAGISC